MKLYGLTQLGRKVISSKSGDSDEFRVLNYMYNNGRTATDDELDIAVEGGRYTARRLKERGLVKELTT